MSDASSSSSDLSLLEQLSDWDADGETDEANNDAPQRSYQQRVNYLHKYGDPEFLYRFRLTKKAVNDLLTEIYPFLKVTSRQNHGISPLHQLLLTLRFYALGTMLVSVADFVGVSKSSAGRIICDVSQAISKLYTKYVFVHNNTQDDFYKIARFPRVLGAIDCTHVLIQSPDSNISAAFRNKKSLLSINVQGVCDANLKFMDVTSYPGITDDATLFNKSELRAQCESGAYGNRWLLGDSAYPCKPYILTPVVQPHSINELNYNEAHSRTRNTIERCFHLWKRRFPILSLKIRRSLDTTESIIIATSVLHNLCRQHNLQDVEPEVEVPEYDMNMNYDCLLTPDLNEYHERQSLINNYFTP